MTLSNASLVSELHIQRMTLPRPQLCNLLQHELNLANVSIHAEGHSRRMDALNVEVHIAVASRRLGLVSCGAERQKRTSRCCSSTSQKKGMCA